MSTKIIYTELITAKRFLEETTNKDVDNSLTSDKARVIFSSPFRRLQQKTQVFGLETNAGVRSRLTHTLEVANTGIAIAKRIANSLIAAKKMDEKLRMPFIEITETCCLLHDIGNPPFGHFGEAAIRKWFTMHWQQSFSKAINVSKADEKTHSMLSSEMINDFLCFDGNPQGVRIILHLKNLPIENYEHGFNLTFSQILSCVKYIGTPNDVIKNPTLHKKAGYFFSESSKIQYIREHFNWEHRFPITYIMEAADDISYCLSDIEDGIEKGVISTEQFFNELNKIWDKPNLKKLGIEKKGIEKLNDYKSPEDFYYFKIRLTRNLIKIASDLYISNETKILTGKCDDLLDNDIDAKSALNALKDFARKFLFRSKEAENIELAGYKVIFGLLESYKDLLELNAELFDKLTQAENDTNILKGMGLDIPWRLYNKLPAKHRDAYKLEIKKLDPKNKLDFNQKEWFYRAHLIVDYISGMTDNFALETFRMHNGITIHNNG